MIKVKKVSRWIVIINLIANLVIAWFVVQNYKYIKWLESEYEIIDSVFDIKK